MLGIHGEAIAAELVQGLCAVRERGDDRKLAIGEFAHECVLFGDLGIGPAPGAVELRHYHRCRARRRPFLQPDLIDPVLVAVQAEQSPVAAQPYAVQRIEHAIGREPGVGRGLVGIHARIVRDAVRSAVTCILSLPRCKPCKIAENLAPGPPFDELSHR